MAEHGESLVAETVVVDACAGRLGIRFTKQNLDTANFQNAIGYIHNDDDGYWCGRASASIVQDRDGTHYCAIQMPNYVVPVEEEAAE